MSEWQQVQFLDLLDSPVRNGIYKKNIFHGSGTKIINMGELFANPRIKDVPMKRLRLNTSEKERFLVKEGDLLFARRSLTAEGAGKCSIVHTILEGTTFESSIIRARPDKSKASPDFLYYYFNSPYGKYLLRTIRRQVAVAGITGGDLMELLLTVPPLPEQRAIAGVLSALDDKIDLLHRQNETLEALAQTLFRQWFVEEAEDDWEVGVIPDEFDFTMGLSPPGTSYNEEAIGTPMFQGNADFTFRFPRRRVFTTDPRRFAEKFDTLISVRAPVGAQNMALERCCIGRGVAAFRYKRNSQYFSYIYNKLKSIMAEIRQFEDSGTVFGSINKSDFESLEIIIPPTELVDKFEYEVSPLDEKIYRNCLQIRTLEKLRDMLLPKLMSGEVRVVRS